MTYWFGHSVSGFQYYGRNHVKSFAARAQSIIQRSHEISMKPYSRQVKITIAMFFIAFIFLAIPSAVTSVGWPAIRDEFGLRQDAIGPLLIMGTIGHLISGAFNGRLMYLLGARKLLLAAILTFAISLFGYGFAPVWAVMLGMGLVGGWAAGTIDATVNTIVAARFNERIMNWLHGFFGVGATLGPLVISLVIVLGSDWRGGAFTFGTLLLILFLVLAFFPALLSNTSGAEQDDANVGEESAVSGLATLRYPIVWIAVLFFFVYGGIEVSIGQWAFTLLTESRGVTDEAARFWVSAYWGTFTFGRFLFGVISPWLPAKVWLRGCVTLTALSLILLLFPNSKLLALLSLALVGIVQAPIFATLISLMPNIVGREHASNALGYVVGAAGVGVAFLPSIAGVLAERFSLEAIPPFILGLAIVLAILFELMLRNSSAIRTT